MSWLEVGWLAVTLGAIYLIGTLSVSIINEAVRSDELQRPSDTPNATIIVPLPVSVSQRR